MRTFWKIYIIVMAVVIAIFFHCIAHAGDESKQILFLDGVRFSLSDGSYESADFYLNEARTDLHKWKSPKGIAKCLRRIRTDANFCVLGIDGNTPKDRRKKIHIDLDNQAIFEKAFSFQAKEGKKDVSRQVCNPDDYIWIVVRMIPDCSKINVPFLFTYISKEDAFKLGCPDENVQEYMRKRKGKP